MHLHLDCFFLLLLLFFSIFQCNLRSIIENNYFCKNEKKILLLAQAMRDVNSQICPMVHSVAKFSYETVCVYAPFEFCIVNTFLFVCQTHAGAEGKWNLYH